ncbi:MAG TPA: dihydrolipoyl dehydrogenase [Alkalispirochaeta sp.]|nr:dihydrolipoyl dehydrogenase [Alkalispirochaeta sp.]
MSTYDVIVVGGGPGGYVGAIRAAQLGLTVAVVDKRATLGGTCLNVGCIPSKALLDSSEFFAKARDEASTHGVEIENLSLNLEAMHRRKDGVVKKLTGGVATLVKSNKIDVYHGIGWVRDKNTVEVLPPDTEPGGEGAAVSAGASTATLEGAALLLATGSVPVELPFLPFDGKTVVDSTGALAFDTVPKQLIVVGGGVIGLELGSVWARLGAKVTVVEVLPTIMTGWDAQVSKTMKRELGKQGLEFKLETKVTGVTVKRGKATLTATDKSGTELELTADKVLVAVGRRPYTEGANLDALGLEMDGSRIAVDDHFATSVAGVYAIGDIVHGPMLAHKAEDEGMAAAERIAGKPGHVNYDTIPNVIYTWPEAASVGRTEEQLKETGIQYRSGTFPFAANGRALAMDSTGGFVKILADAETDRVLGAHIVGPWASDLLAEIVSVMEFGGSAEDIARTVHSHPTLTEVVKEAALGVDGRMIHAKN